MRFGVDSTSPACCALALTSFPQQSRDPIGIALRVIDAMTRMGTEYILILNVIYGGSWMTKRLIDLDDELLARAGRELGTSGVSDTVRLALQQATPAAARGGHHALAKSGRHRAVGIAALLTATVAAQHRLTILHYDADFDIASQVIDFDHRWVAERGTLRP